MNQFVLAIVFAVYMHISTFAEGSKIGILIGNCYSNDLKFRDLFVFASGKWHENIDVGDCQNGMEIAAYSGPSMVGVVHLTAEKSTYAGLKACVAKFTGTRKMIMNDSGEYETLCGPPAIRPAIVIQRQKELKAFFAERMKKINASNDILENFRREIGRGYYDKCLQAGVFDSIAITQSSLMVYEYENRHLKGKLLTVGLDFKLYSCDGPPGNVWSTLMFFDDGKRIRMIGKDLEFISASDFNSDGSVEFAFWHANYHEEGVRLFDANLNMILENIISKY